jgi:hypothetical protein
MGGPYNAAMQTKRRAARFTFALAFLVAMLWATTAAASADPSTPATLTYVFTECSGPAGTPKTFDAVKQPGGAAALHLVDGRGIFVAVQATDVETGTILFSTPGFEHNQLPTVSCLLFHPVSRTWQSVVGMLAPLE